MGLEEPWPGRAVFHAMFVVSSHFVGRALSSAVAMAPGPRNWRHSAARSHAVAVSRAAVAMKTRFRHAMVMGSTLRSQGTPIT